MLFSIRFFTLVLTISLDGLQVMQGFNRNGMSHQARLIPAVLKKCSFFFLAVQTKNSLSADFTLLWDKHPPSVRNHFFFLSASEQVSKLFDSHIIIKEGLKRIGPKWRCVDSRESVRYMGYYQEGLRPKAFQIRERTKVLRNGIYSTEHSPFSGSRSIQFVLATLRKYFRC